MPKKHLDYAVTAFTMLKMFRLEHEVHWLLGGQVNCLSNVLSFHVELHRAFHRFALWLEAIPGQVRSTLFSLLHDHSIKSDRNIHMMWIWLKGNNLHYHWIDPRLPLMINPDCAALCRERGSTPLPKLPSPDLIAIKVIFAQVANISGAAEQIDWILQDEKKVYHGFGGWWERRRYFSPRFSTRAITIDAQSNYSEVFWAEVVVPIPLVFRALRLLLYSLHGQHCSNINHCTLCSWLAKCDMA